MVALESESGESSESKTRPLKFSGSGPAQEKSTEKRLLDSLDSLSLPLAPPKPSPAGVLGPGESTGRHSPSDSPHSLNQASHSPPKKKGNKTKAAEGKKGKPKMRPRRKKRRRPDAASKADGTS